MTTTHLRFSHALAVLAVALAAPLSTAQASYTQVATLPELLGPGNSGFLDTVVTDGDDYYALGRTFGSVPGSGDSLTKFSGGTATVLVTDAQWATASASQLAGFYGARVVGDDIIFPNFFDNTVYSVDKNTGAITTIAGPLSGNLTSNSAVAPDGTAYVYDSTADEILKVETNGTVTVAVSNATLVAGLGTDLVSGGFEVVGDDLYVGRDSTNNIIAFDLTTPGTFTPVFSGAAAVETVTVDSDGDIDFEDIFYAPNGLVYFFEDDSDAILSFDPSDPDGTIASVLKLTQLTAGPGTNNVDQFSWLNGNLAWTDQDDFNDVGGFYVIPEPTTFGLLAFGSLALLRRRSIAC